MEYGNVKTCSKCKKEKSIIDFYRASKAKDGLQDYCKSCSKTIYKQFLKNNPDKQKYYDYKKYASYRKVLDDYKINKGCAKCNYNAHPAALDFHHLDPSKKEFNIGHKVQRGFKNLKQEIDKCVLLCKNCHTVFHIKERHEGVTIEQFLR